MSVIIRLQNLPMSANASNIRRFFVGLAIPEGGVHIVGGTDGDAFIAFATDEDARKAMLLDRQTINGAPVRLFLSSKAEMQSVIESARSSALYAGIASTPPIPAVPQKTEAMQALDVTAPTLPSSFPSYRNGVAIDSYADGRGEQLTYAGTRLSPSPSRQFEHSTLDSYPASVVRMPPRLPERPGTQESLPLNRDYEYNHQPHPFSRYDDLPNQLPGIPDYPSRDHLGHSNPPDPYKSYYENPIYDHLAPDDRFNVLSSDVSRDDPRGAYGDVRHGRTVLDYDKQHSPAKLPDRFPREAFSREPDFRRPDQGTFPPYAVADRQRLPPFDRQPPPPADVRSLAERDFSVRPPWLSEEAASHGSKRPLPPQTDFDDYSGRKKRALPVSKMSGELSPLETDLVVRLALPVAEVSVKSVFEVLRGVHIVPKWGIRMEEDAVQRPTGYIYIMLTARESFDRALSYNGHPYKGKSVKVTQTTPDEFYRVSDSSFRQKCPPEIAKKLPTPSESFKPPHHNDGCLEVSELPPDVTRLEIVRFLGAPGLSASDVVIASFAPSDRTASQNPKSVRALVILPSAKDLEILLSAKPRPLRPDGTFPPVRLIPISRLQLEAFSVYCLDKKSVIEVAKSDKPETNKSDVTESVQPSTGAPLTCAYISGLARYLRDSEVLRLFPSALIPGDAIRMIPPTNTSAYVDFISENNCRRAIADITTNESKAKLAHPDIHIEPISRSEMESKLQNLPKPEESHNNERSTRAPIRDPRDARSWDPRAGPRPRHGSPVAFRPRTPPTMRSGYEGQYYDRGVPTVPFEDGHGAPPRRPRPPIDMPPLPSDYHQPHNLRPIDHQPLPPSSRRPVPDFVTVFVGNLPPSVTVDQLVSIMRDYYFVPGSVRIRRDIHGIPTGGALVDFNSNYDADRVIRDLNGYRIAGRPIVLRYDRRS